MGLGTLSGQAYQNICHRILGEKIPIMDLTQKKVWFGWLRGLTKRV